MDFLSKYNLTTRGVLTFAGLALLALVVLAFISSFVQTNFNLSDKSYSTTPGMGVGSAPSYYDGDDVALSSRNVAEESMPMPPGDTYTPGMDAEAFEVKEYHSSIETRDSERDCGSIRELKSRESVIFEHANEHERGCDFTFKVANADVQEILTVITALDPRELTERSYTIKREVTDYTSEIEILEAKLATINTTLERAIAEYDDITSLATNARDVESLAKIIESKLTIVERLTNEKLRTTSDLERINRRKAEALDRLAYTYFYVSVRENKYVDPDALKDSWKAAVQQFVYDLNRTAEELTVGLLSLLFVILKYLIYFFILLFVVRFVYGAVKKIWRNEP